MVQLVLSGDENNVAMPMTDAEVNHLRRLLAWIRLEHALDEHMMAGFLEGARITVEHEPHLRGRAQQVVDNRVRKIERVPKYIRQAVKMLTKAVRDHDAETRVVEPTTPESP